jgi:hypothetical protein
MISRRKSMFKKKCFIIAIYGLGLLTSFTSYSYESRKQEMHPLCSENDLNRDWHGISSQDMAGLPYRQSLIVGPPKGAGIQYDREGYTVFQRAYQSRREMLYFLDNHGQLHTLDAGEKYDHFVPPSGNIKPYAFDAKIFQNSSTHPQGWGTLLFAGSGGSASHCFVFDITDPEQPPILLSNFSDPDMGSCSAQPTAFTLNGGLNHSSKKELRWFLALGSGEGAEQAKVYFYDLETMGLVKTILVDKDSQESHIGGISAVDLNHDGVTDVLYLGTLAENASGLKGDLYSITFTKLLHDKLASSSTDDVNENKRYKHPKLAKLFESPDPIPDRPLIKRDKDGNAWVFFSTGRVKYQRDYRSPAKRYLSSSVYALKEDLFKKHILAHQLGLGFARERGWYRKLHANEFFNSPIHDLGEVIAISSYRLDSYGCEKSDSKRLNLFNAYTGEILDELLPDDYNGGAWKGRMLENVGSLSKSLVDPLLLNPKFLENLTEYNKSQIDKLENAQGKEIIQGVRRLSWWQQ